MDQFLIQFKIRLNRYSIKINLEFCCRVFPNARGLFSLCWFRNNGFIVSIEFSPRSLIYSNIKMENNSAEWMNVKYKIKYPHFQAVCFSRYLSDKQQHSFYEIFERCTNLIKIFLERQFALCFEINESWSCNTAKSVCYFPWNVLTNNWKAFFQTVIVHFYLFKNFGR